jgi:serine/threonine-protein kinase
MDASTPHIDDLRPGTPQRTQLTQLCGSETRFRDRYQIMRALGRGGFGVTFLAKDVLLPHHPLCVIKQLCPKVANPVVFQRACQRFEREAKTLSQLGSHAQVPRLLDYFEQNGEFYLVQEYVRGRTLAKEVKLRGVFSEAEVKIFLQELLPVLIYIHQQQVIHRDIKPPNIIRCQDDGRLVLIDFGAVKEQFIKVDETTHRGATTHFVGTLGFAPPEQLSLRATYASDIFAIGVTSLYLLTGKPPMEFEYDIDTGEVKWQDAVQVSPYFAKVLDKMLKVSPRDRYQSADEVLRAIELEPYLDSLASCMSNHPLGPVEDEDLLYRGYLSPIVRTAIAIRRWRKRKLAAERRRKDSEMVIY